MDDGSRAQRGLNLPAWSDEDSTLFGFPPLTAGTGAAEDSDSWLTNLRDAMASQDLGSIGPYRLIEEVGRGSQGIVYRAIDPDTGRTLAIKRLLAGAFATPNGRRRFQREVEATRMLDHPSIVKVLDVDTADASPYLVMEWVEGIAVTAWAHRDSRPLEDRLRLFLTLCEAVAHAHGNGVLHRDLKPSNVLVEASGRPCVLDFGLAKRLEHGEDESVLTASSGFVGTLAYAAPEQIDSSGQAVDVRSDVYSLGVLLYEVLTGTRPYDASGFRELLEAQQREKFAAPSKLVPGCRRDLDAICAKALAADPSERFQSAGALAQDLERFLRGENVQAVLPSAAYHLRKAVRRNPLGAGLLAVLTLCILGFTLLSVRQARALDRQRVQALEAGEAETLARARAEDAEKGMRQAMGFLLSELVAPADPRKGKRDQTVLQAIERVDARASEVFDERPELEFEVRDALAKVYLGLERFDQSSAQLTRALELSPRESADERARAAVLRGRLGQALLGEGKNDDARSELEAARDVLRQTPGFERALATTLDCISRFHRQAGDLELAESTAREAIALLAEHAGENHRDELQTLRANLALTLMHMERMEEALAIHVDCLEALKGFDGTRVDVRRAAVLGNMAVAQIRMGAGCDAAETAQREAEICSRVFGEDHRRVGNALLSRAIALLLCEQLDLALETARAAARVFSELPRRRTSLAASHQLIGRALGQLGDPDGALDAYQTALAIYVEESGADGSEAADCRLEIAQLLARNERCADLERLLGEWFAEGSAGEPSPTAELKELLGDCSKG